MAKTRALISFAVTAKLICVFVFANADCWFSRVVAQIITTKFVCLIQFYVPFKFISTHMRRVYQKVKSKTGEPREKPASRTWLVSHVLSEGLKTIPGIAVR